MLTRIIKKIAVFSGVIWILIFTIWISLSLVLFIKKDEIGKYLLFYLNQNYSGEFEVGYISISPIRQFPRINLNLENVSLFEHKRTDLDSIRQPIAKIENFYCDFELLQLLKGKINIYDLTIENGELLAKIYPDSSINFINALRKKPTTQQQKLPQISQEKKTGFSFDIEKLIINNLQLKFINDPMKRESSIIIKNFDAEFSSKENLTKLNFNSSILIEKLMLDEHRSISNQEIHLDISSHLDQTNKIEIENGKLEISKATFDFRGYFNPYEKGDLYLKINSDGSLSILSLFINEDVMKKLKKGDFYFGGSIDGQTFSEFPSMNFNFALNDVELINPVTKRKIKNLNLQGSFNSGYANDFSEATLQIDTLFADFPNGHLNLSGFVNNFKQPEFDLTIYLNADVTGLDDVFKLSDVDSLHGKIELSDKFKGKYIPSTKKFSSTINQAEISLQNFGFVIPGTIRFDSIDGTIQRKGDDYLLRDLKIKSEATDLIIDGEIRNLQYLIFGIEKDINASLAIKSDVFDLPNFLFFDPSIKRDFPHRILNLDLLVDAHSSTQKLLHFKSFPQIIFDIKKLDATAEGFLPELKINSGVFGISEDLLGFHLDFNEFKTDFIDGRFDFSGNYTSSKFNPYYIKSSIDVEGIDISKILFDNSDDSIPSFYKSKMYGSLFLELQFADDTSEIKLLNLENVNLDYCYGADTIHTYSLRFLSKEIDYNLKENDNPLATLFATGKIKAKEVKTSQFIVNNADFGFEVQKGQYIIETSKPIFFGPSSKGSIKYRLNPFLEIPTYEITSDISSFNIKEMMYTFLKDTTISGNFSLYMDIFLRGGEWKDMLKTMSGEINLSGKNLTFYGIDADKMIAEFQRSQNFNLVDAGAVLLAGPVGLAVTKGTDFAKILIMNPGESSLITNLISKWEIDNGRFILKDVAASTKLNRVAAKGWINMVSDSLKISFAVIDDKGCIIFTQNVYGDLNKPTLEKVKVVGTLLAPVTNLYDNIMNVNCHVFYKGSLPPPK